MHYLGNASIINYQCSYAVSNVVGAALIAAAASTIALAMFFVFRAAWTNSWWRRVGCAVVLAGAVSGMHWCAAMGTSYTLLHLNPIGNTGSRDVTVAVVICLVSRICLWS
jgi:NO-binding membrane sensor protein with MHYT domain